MRGARKSSLTPVQGFALASEVRTAVALSRRGIDELHELSVANDFYHLPMQLLAQGFERLLKLTYSLAHLRHHGTLPDPLVFRRKYKHDMLALLDDLLPLVDVVDDYTRRPAVQDDLNFLRHDADVRQLVTILSGFGDRARYYRFEEFLDPSGVRREEDPDVQWQALEGRMIDRIPNAATRLRSPSENDALFAQVASMLAAHLETLGRALTRMWTLGAVHEEARFHLGVIRDFLYLRDHELGNRRS